MTKNIKFIDKIERLEAFEEQFGIRLEALSVKLELYLDEDYSSFTVGGDVFAVNGTKIDQDIELVISCHDAAGKVLISKKHSIDAKSFSGIDTFSEEFYYALLPFIGVEKVRIYPKLAE
ncbi:MAG: hypothetical protein RLZZ171_362 [Cyanobacteriota bacterium]|jgi:hypothetical protein